MSGKRYYLVTGTTRSKEIARSWEIVTPKRSLNFDSSNVFLFDVYE